MAFTPGVRGISKESVGPRVWVGLVCLLSAALLSVCFHPPRCRRSGLSHRCTHARIAAGSAVLGLMQRPTRWTLWLGLASMLVVSLACSNGQDGPAPATAMPAPTEGPATSMPAPTEGPATSTPATGPTIQITIPEKTELKHPKLGSMLDDLIARVEAGEVSAEDAAQEAPVQDGDLVAVTIDLSGNVEGVLSFLEGNGGSRVSPNPPKEWVGSAF